MVECRILAILPVAAESLPTSGAMPRSWTLPLLGWILAGCGQPLYTTQNGMLVPSAAAPSALGLGRVERDVAGAAEIGAGDARFLMWSMLTSMAAGVSEGIAMTHWSPARAA